MSLCQDHLGVRVRDEGDARLVGHGLAMAQQHIPLLAAEGLAFIEELGVDRCVPHETVAQVCEDRDHVVDRCGHVLCVILLISISSPYTHL